MEFQPGDRVYHTRKRGNATVVHPIDCFSTLIEFDDPIGSDHKGCKRGHGWTADNDLLKLISEASDDTPIDITSLL